MTPSSRGFRALLMTALAVGAPLSPLHAQPRALIGSGTRHARATIETIAVTRGAAELLVTLHVDPGWHVSWRNPGETGLPTRLSWSLPAGVRAIGETWPVPVISHTPVGATHTLEGSVPWLVRLGVDSASAVDRLIGLTVRYGVCREVCIPEQLTVQGVLPASGRPLRLPVPAAARARLATDAGVIAARRRSPSELCFDRLPLVNGDLVLEIVADSGRGMDAAQPARRTKRRGSHGFVMNIPDGATLRSADEFLVVRGSDGARVRIDLERPAPNCR